MITPIYGSGGCFFTLNNGATLELISMFTGMEVEISFKQENSTNEANNGVVLSKTVGWRPRFSVEIINMDASIYNNIITLKDIINGYNNDTSKEIRIYPRSSASDYYYLVELELDSDIDIEDLVERLDIGQSLSLSFIGKELQSLPYYV